MKRHSVIGLALVLLVGACAAHSDDPAKGGFFSGMKNLSDGTYDRRLQQREKALQDEQDQNVRNQRQVERVVAQRDAMAAQRSAAEARSASLQRELASLKAKLRQSKKETAGLQRDIDTLNSKIAVVEQDSFTPEPEKLQRLETLRKEKEALDREVELAVRR